MVEQEPTEGDPLRNADQPQTAHRSSAGVGTAVRSESVYSALFSQTFDELESLERELVH